MEGNEGPKVDSSLSVPNAENKELSIKADELAKATRERGMGIFNGYFIYKKDGESKGYEPKGYFIQGEEAPNGYLRDHRALVNTSGPLEFFNQHNELEAWMKSNYQVPMGVEVKSVVVQIPRTRQIKEKKFFGLKTNTRVERYTTETIESERSMTNNPRTYKGKRGDFDWLQYDYLMRDFGDGRGRRGRGIMVIVVPPDIAKQIDEQVNKNVYFPDAFFKPLYPNFQPNSDSEYRYATRVEAKGLQVIDLVKDPYNPKTDIIDRKGKLHPYPQPLNAKPL